MYRFARRILTRCTENRDGPTPIDNPAAGGGADAANGSRSCARSLLLLFATPPIVGQNRNNGRPYGSPGHGCEARRTISDTATNVRAPAAPRSARIFPMCANAIATIMPKGCSTRKNRVAGVCIAAPKSCNAAVVLGLMNRYSARPMRNWTSRRMVNQRTALPPRPPRPGFACASAAIPATITAHRSHECRSSVAEYMRR